MGKGALNVTHFLVVVEKSFSATEELLLKSIHHFIFEAAT